MTGDSADKEQKKTSRRVISLADSKDPEHLRSLGFTTEFIKIVQNIDPDEAERRQTQEKIKQDANVTHDLGADGLMDILTDLYKKRDKELKYLKDNLPEQLPEKYKNQVKNIKQGVDLLTFIIKKYDGELRKVASAEKEKAKFEQSRKLADKELIEKVERNTTNFFGRFGQFYTDTAERDFWKNTYKNKLMNFLAKQIQERKCKVLSDNGDFKIKISDPVVALDVLMELYKYDNDLITNTLNEHDKLQRDHTSIIKSLESRLPDSYMDFINLIREKTSRRTEKDRMEIQKDLDDASNMDKEELIKRYQDHRIEFRALEDLVFEHKNLIPGIDKLSDRVSKINRVLNILKDYKDKLDAHEKGLSESRESLQVFADNYLDAANTLVNDINALKNVLSEEAKIHIGQTAKQEDPLKTLELIAGDVQKVGSAIKSLVDDKNVLAEEYRKFTETTENRMKDYSEIFKKMSGIKEEKERLEEQIAELQQELAKTKPKAQLSERYENEITALKKQISSNAEQLAYIDSLEQQITSLKKENDSLKQKPYIEVSDQKMIKEYSELKRANEILERKLKKYKLGEDAPEDVQLREDKYAVMLHERFRRIKNAFVKYNVFQSLDPANYAHARLPAVMAHEKEAFLKILGNYRIFLTDFENLVNLRLIPLENQAKERYNDIIKRLPRKMRGKNIMEARQNIINLLEDSEKRMQDYKETKNKKIKELIEENKSALIKIIQKKKQIEPDAEERLSILQNPGQQETNQEYYEILNFMSLNREITNAYHGHKDNEGNFLVKGIVDFDEAEDLNEGQKLAEKYDYPSFKDLKKEIEDMVENVGLVQQRNDLNKKEELFMSRFKYKMLKTVHEKLDALKIERDQKTEKRLYENVDDINIAEDYKTCKEMVDLTERIDLAESHLLSKAQEFDPSINTERRAVNLVNRLVKKIAEYGGVVAEIESEKKKFIQEYGFIIGTRSYGALKTWVEQHYEKLEDIDEEPDDESRICKVVKKLDPEKSHDYTSSINYLKKLVSKREFTEIKTHLSFLRGLKEVFKQDFNSAEALLNLIKEENNKVEQYYESLQAAQKRIYYIEQEFKDKIQVAKDAAQEKKQEVLTGMDEQKKKIFKDIF